MAKKNGRGGPAYSDLSASDDASDNDGMGLVITDSDSSGGRSRKYVVTQSNAKRAPLHTRIPLMIRSLTRNEKICIVVGLIAFIAIVALFVVVGVVTQIQGTSAANSTDTPTTHIPPTQPSPTSQPHTTQPSSHTQTAQTQNLWDNVRLPSSVIPDHYNVCLTVDLNTFTVMGTVDIACQIVEATEYILVHAKEMSIQSGLSHVEYSNEMINFEGMFVEMNEFYVMTLPKKLQPGDITIHLTFNYTLSTKLSGFYRSSYTDTNGQPRYLATTQFESTDARKAFPCFDEPALKANFTIHITHSHEYHAVSNMPIENITADEDNGMTTTHFLTSVKMSTYLVAFVVSDFACVNNTVTENRVQPLQIRVCSNPLIVDKTQYALQVATDVIQFYEDVFNTTYPLPKQDLFAIPDFAAGAMENWGLITYRETAVLYDETTNPASSKQRVTVVIAHELAHQWFGNLVTMAWWDGLWLNEGFASFTEYLGTDRVQPSWAMLDQFFVEDSTNALTLDSLNESHPIIQPVSNPNEISSLFDSISYDKGASLIRMIQHYLTQENFRAGITSYLMAHEYGNAETSQLWDSLQLHAPAGSTATVSEIMDTWTRQMGYPVFSVQQSTGHLSQTRFLAVQPPEGSSLLPSPYNYVWKAPFNYITQSNSTLVSMLVVNEDTSLIWPQGQGWIKANVGQFGYYRVNYELSNWQLLSRYLRNNPSSNLLPPVDRAGLLDDAFALASAGQLDMEVVVELSRYLVDEREYLPWSAALSWLNIFGRRLSLTPLYGQYSNFVQSLLDPVVSTFSFNDTSLSHLQIFLRSEVFSAAAHYGNDDIMAQAGSLFQLWRTQNISVNPDLKSVVYSAGIANGDPGDWDFLWERYNAESDPYEKRLLLRALASSREPWVLSRYLSYTLDRIRLQDQLSVVVLVSRNIHGRYLAWNFLRNNWNYYLDTFGHDSFFDRVIRYVTESFSTEFELQEVSNFFSHYPDAGSGTRAYRQAIEAIRGNIDWLNSNQNLGDVL